MELQSCVRLVLCVRLVSRVMVLVLYKETPCEEKHFNKTTFRPVRLCQVNGHDNTGSQTLYSVGGMV